MANSSDTPGDYAPPLNPDDLGSSNVDSSPTIPLVDVQKVEAGAVAAAWEQAHVDGHVTVSVIRQTLSLVNAALEKIPFPT